MGIISIRIVMPDDKKTHLYQHRPYMIRETSQPIIIIVNAKETEPEIHFSMVLMNHLWDIWRIRTTFPKGYIMPWDDNISGAFPQLFFHPDTA
jgi:hypothetical protein